MGGVNPYGYVSNPLSYIDPLGLCKTDVNQMASGHGPKTAKEMAEELADKINRNSVNFSTSTKMGHIDLRGRSHFDKASQNDIPTPHVQTSDVNIRPDGARFPLKKTEVAEAATKQDIRTARKLAKHQGLL